LKPRSKRKSCRWSSEVVEIKTKSVKLWFRSYLASLNIDLLQRGYIAKGRDVAAILLFGFKATIITSMFSVDASFFPSPLAAQGI
jgi:hypothetical protein